MVHYKLSFFVGYVYLNTEPAKGILRPCQSPSTSPIRLGPLYLFNRLNASRLLKQLRTPDAHRGLK